MSEPKFKIGDTVTMRSEFEDGMGCAGMVPTPQEKLHEAEMRGASSVILLRCIKHITVPQQNKNEHGGGECGACIAAERDAFKAVVEMIAVELDCPSRNTTMTSYRRDGSVIISHPTRAAVNAILNKPKL